VLLLDVRLRPCRYNVWNTSARGADAGLPGTTNDERAAPLPEARSPKVGWGGEIRKDVGIALPYGQEYGVRLNEG